LWYSKGGDGIKNLEGFRKMFNKNVALLALITSLSISLYGMQKHVQTEIKQGFEHVFNNIGHEERMQSVAKMIAFLSKNRSQTVDACFIDELVYRLYNHGSDVWSLFLKQLSQDFVDHKVPESVFDLIVEALKRSIDCVHYEVFTCIPWREFVKYNCYVQSLARAAVARITQLSPKSIIAIAQLSKESSMIIARAVLQQSAVMNSVCPDTIVELASINHSVARLLKPVMQQRSPLTPYLITQHSGRAGMCASCKGKCRFHADRDDENIAKLIKGVRSICCVGYRGRDKALLAMKEVQDFYCIYSKQHDDYIVFTKTGEKNAKLLKLYEDDGIHALEITKYIFGKIMGYSEEDIEFFFMRLRGKLTVNEAITKFRKIKEEGSAWLEKAKKRVDSIADWQPQRFYDVVSGLAENRAKR